MSDKDVVEKGLPRCANAGKNCSNEATPAAVVATSTGEALNNVQNPNSQAVSETELKVLLSDPKTVRELLVANGMDKKLLDEISDSDLSMLVKQLMASSTIQNSTSTTN
jgi:hypothetical protein